MSVERALATLWNGTAERCTGFKSESATGGLRPARLVRTGGASRAGHGEGCRPVHGRMTLPRAWLGIGMGFPSSGETFSTTGALRGLDEAAGGRERDLAAAEPWMVGAIT
jgi:hypothetical protein